MVMSSGVTSKIVLISHFSPILAPARRSHCFQNNVPDSHCPALNTAADLIHTRM